MAPTTAATVGLTITANALAKIREVMGQQELGADERNLRIFVESAGGCCGGGPSFGLAFDRAQADDTRFEQGGMPVVVDPASLPYCAGATIDYLDTPEVQGFKVSAPKLAKESEGCGSGGCGCGNGGGGGGGCCGSESEASSGHSHAAKQEHSHGGCGSGSGGCH